jgi:hypothetical protein
MQLHLTGQLTRQIDMLVCKLKHVMLAVTTLGRKAWLTARLPAVGGQASIKNDKNIHLDLTLGQ